MSQTFTRKELYYSRRFPAGTAPGERIGIETEIIVRAAEKLGIRWSALENTQLISLSYKDKTVLFRRRMPATTTFIGASSCADKNATRELLTRAGVSHARGYFITKTESERQIKDIFHALSKPLVVKVSEGTHGEGVLLDITAEDEFVSSVKKLLSSSVREYEGVLAEEQFQGTEYRILVTREKVIGIMHRIPCNVTGDGSHCISELIKIKNTDPMRNIEHWLYPHITLDEQMLEILDAQKLTAESILPNGETVYLRSVSNIMAGGDAVDYTDTAHPSVAAVALQAIRAIPGLQWAGIDFMTTDITKEQTADTYSVIEVNGSPEFAMHDIPMIGKKRGAAETFIRLMFPEL